MNTQFCLAIAIIFPLTVTYINLYLSEVIIKSITSWNCQTVGCPGITFADFLQVLCNTDRFPIFMVTTLLSTLKRCQPDLFVVHTVQPTDIYQGQMARYSLYALKLPLNTNQTRKCTLWRCKSTPTPKAKLLWMTSHYGSTVVRSVTEIPFHVFI